MSKCKHSRTELILRSRRYETVQEIKVDVWHDFIVGVKCRDCNDIMPTPEIMTTYYPYRGEPHYPEKETDYADKVAEYFETSGGESNQPPSKEPKKPKSLPEMGNC